MPKITPGITGLHEILGRIYRIEEPCWRPSKDEHLHVIIYDNDSPDNDLKQALQRSTLKN